jgi:hypothetical protein
MVAGLRFINSPSATRHNLANAPIQHIQEVADEVADQHYADPTNAVCEKLAATLTHKRQQHTEDFCLCHRKRGCAWTFQRMQLPCLV